MFFNHGIQAHQGNEGALAGNGRCMLSIIHLDCVVRAAHLLPVYGSSFLPEDFHFMDSLDLFRACFVNSYIDHHSNEFL
jgi:hypothetical protein